MDSRTKELREHYEALVSDKKAERRAAQERGFMAWFKSVFSVGGEGKPEGRRWTTAEKMRRGQQAARNRAARRKATGAGSLTSQERMATRKGWGR